MCVECVVCVYVWSCRDDVTKQVDAVGRLGFWWLFFLFLYLILIDWIGFVANWQNRYREGRCLFLSLKHLTDGEEGCRYIAMYLPKVAS